MRLYIKQRIFSWTDSYDVYDETGEARYKVKADFLAFGHQIRVYDKRTGMEIGSIHEKLFALLPRFDIVIGGRTQGCVQKEFTFLRPRYRIDYRGCNVEGDFMGWDYQVMAGSREIMSITKELFNWSDTYVLRYDDPADELAGLLLVIAIDAANCSKNKN